MQRYYDQSMKELKILKFSRQYSVLVYLYNKMKNKKLDSLKDYSYCR